MDEQQIIADLRAATLAEDKAAFAVLVAMLTDKRQVQTPMLHAIANAYRNENIGYTGRKSAIDAIAREFQFNIRFAAKTRALDRVGV